MSQLHWRKSSFSNSAANCLYVASDREAIRLGESRQPDAKVKAIEHVEDAGVER